MSTELITVREVSSSDLGKIVELHLAAFPGFLMSMLGPGFLRTYYAAVLDYPGRIFLGIERDTALSGFVAGFVDPAEFYRSLKRRKAQMMLRGVGHVAIRPAIWLRVVENVREVGARGAEEHADTAIAELASLAVHPAMSRGGLGKSLVTSFIEQARAHAVRKVCLTTDVANNNGVNRFYVSLGFTRAATVKRGAGRVMNAYEYVV